MNRAIHCFAFDSVSGAASGYYCATTAISRTTPMRLAFYARQSRGGRITVASQL